MARQKNSKSRKANSCEFDDLIIDDEYGVDDVDFESSDNKSFLKAFANDFPKDSEALVKQYMEYFFADKKLHCGGSVPKSMLLNNRRVSMVLNYDICKAADRVYKYTSSNKDLDDGDDEKESFPNDIDLVLNALKTLQDALIPKQFIGGMICLYVEFIEGVYIGTEP